MLWEFSEHLLHSELSDIEESQQVGRDQGIEVFRSKVCERLAVEDPSVIHQIVDCSELLDCCFDSFGCGLLFTDIAIDESQPVRGGQ